MTHTPNSDASERERLIADLEEVGEGWPAALIEAELRAAKMLRADDEEIQRQTEMIAVRDNDIDRLHEQLAARSAEVEALRKAVMRTQKHLTPSVFNVLLDCLQLEGVALPQEKSRDAD